MPVATSKMEFEQNDITNFCHLWLHQAIQIAKRLKNINHTAVEWSAKTRKVELLIQLRRDSDKQIK